MTIEKDLQALTAAVQDLTAAFIAHTNDAAPAKKPASAPTETTSAPAETAKAAAPKKTEAKKAAETAKKVDAEAAEASAVTYPQIQALIKANVTTKRSAITKVLADYKVPTALDLTEDQWGPFFTDLTIALENVGEADLA